MKNYLKECLESLCVQTFKKAEFILVDDGSTDGSSAICDEYAKKDSRFKVIHHGVNRGLLLARKTAITSALGKYTAFLDGDDFYSTSKSLEIMYKNIEDTQVDILRYSVNFHGSDLSRINEVQSFIKGLKDHEKLESLEVLKKIFANQEAGWYIWLNIYKTSVLKKVALEIPEEHLVCAEDVLISFLAFFYAKNFMAVNTEPLYSYRVGTGVSTTKILFEKFPLYAKEIRVVRLINNVLTRVNCPSNYFEITNQLLERTLLNTAIWRMTCVSVEHLKDAFDLIAAEGFYPQLVRTLSHHYCSIEQQYEFAKLLFGSNVLKLQKDHKAKTIAIIYHCFTNGGVERVISLQIPMLLELGYKVVLITEFINKDKEYSLPDGVIRETIPPEIDCGRLQRLDEILDKYKIDVVLYHQSSYWLMLWDFLIIKLRKARLIATLHENPWQDYMDYLNPDIIKFIKARPYYLKFTDSLFVLSRAFIPYFASFGCNVRMMPNPLTFDLEKVDVAPLSMRDGVLWLGRLYDLQKNWNDALIIMQRLVKLNPSLQCFMAGSEQDPNSLQRLKDFIADNNLSNNVHWLGQARNVQHLLQTTRVFLMTSSFEAFPMVLNEAKVCGTPVVCYDLPYLEMLQNSAGCKVVVSRDIDATVEAVEMILKDDKLATQMIKDSRKSVEEYYKQFDLRTMWKNVLENNHVDNFFDKSIYNADSLHEMFDSQTNLVNTRIAKLEDLVRIKDSIVNDKNRIIDEKQREINECNQRNQRLQENLMLKPLRRYKLFEVFKYAIRGKWGLSHRKRIYYRKKLNRIFNQ